MLWQLEGDFGRVDLPITLDHGKGCTLPLPLVCPLHRARARIRRRGEEDSDTGDGEKDIRKGHVAGEANILRPNHVDIIPSTRRLVASDLWRCLPALAGLR